MKSGSRLRSRLSLLGRLVWNFQTAFALKLFYVQPKVLDDFANYIHFYAAGICLVI